MKISKEIYTSKTIKVGKTPVELTSVDPDFSSFGQTRKMLIAQHNRKYGPACLIAPENATEGFISFPSDATFDGNTSVKFFIHCPLAEDVEINVQEVWTDNPIER